MFCVKYKHFKPRATSSRKRNENITGHIVPRTLNPRIEINVRLDMIYDTSFQVKITKKMKTSSQLVAWKPVELDRRKLW